MSNMVKAKEVTFEYTSEDENNKKPHKALNSVNMTVREGEFITILGHNGSGKSTMAKLINALLLPNEGTVLVNGLDTKDSLKIWEIRQTAGMVFQNPDNQIIATVVEEDVAFGPENLGVESDIIKKRVKEAIESVEMTEYSKHSPNKLSGGQKQRIAIAGILAMKPKCIILDEPTAMLDPSGRKEVINTIKKLNKEEGITIILITHFMEEAIESDKVIVMDEGNITLEGTPEEVFVQIETMKDLGLEVPHVTELAFNLNKKGINIPVNILNIKEMVDAICQLK